MKVCGLTGGIGMGKTTATRLLAARGLVTIDTDALAHQLTAPGSKALEEIIRSFGAEYLDDTGSLCRHELARLVFSDEQARLRLNAILHPPIREAWKAELAQWSDTGRAWAVVVIPLLFETGAEREFDCTACVACSTLSQTTRLRERGWDDSHIAQRVSAQWPVELKMAAADYVVWTEGPFSVTDAQLKRIIG